MTTRKQRMREHLTGERLPAKPSGEEPVGDQVRLFPQGMPWPSDLRRYYDDIDRARGIEPPRLIKGYKDSAEE